MAYSKTIVREAAPEDIEAVLAMGKLMMDEGPYRFLPFSDETARRRFSTHLARRDRRCLLLSERDGAPTGMLGGCLDEYLFCEELVAHDAFVFVLAQHRGSLAALLLVHAFQAWAKDRGAREVSLGISNGGPTERIGRFYERLGFTRVGAIYKQRLADH